MIIRRYKKMVIFISIVTLLIVFGGCSNKSEENTTFADADNETSVNETQSTDTVSTPKASESVVEEMALTEIVIGSDPFGFEWNPFFANSVGNQQVIAQTQVFLLNEDRAGEILVNAKDGQKNEFHGVEYTYYGISNVDIKKDDDLNQTTYTINIRDDVTFQDGNDLTIDDVIFSLYVLCDPDYSGVYGLKDTDIVGLENYLSDNSLADTVTEEMIKDKLDHPSQELQTKVRNEAILPFLYSELEFCRVILENEDYKEFVSNYTRAKDVLAMMYSIDTNFDPTSIESEKEVVEALADQYGPDYKLLAKKYGEEDYFDEIISEWVMEEIYSDLLEQGASPVPSITGITKLSKTSVAITTNGYNPNFLYQLVIPICPLHYYGDEELYDYDKNLYGFTKGDLSIVSEASKVPMGAGPYSVVLLSEDSAELTAYHNFYLGAPATNRVKFLSITEEEKIIALGNGEVDIVDIVGSNARFKEIKKYNSNGEINGDHVVTNFIGTEGYGYIGMNAENVCVGEAPDSTESKYLRMALAIILSVYRDTAIESYYGDAATIIQYPGSYSSWIKTLQTENRYDSVCFGTDLNGIGIYSNEMTWEDRYRVAINTAKQYLTAAGYVYNQRDSKFVEAPEGGSLEFTLFINGEGTGDHPSYAIVKAAKAALETIGISLHIIDVNAPAQLWDAIEEGNADLWCAAWGITEEPQFNQKYNSRHILGNGGFDTNHYRLSDEKLDELLVLAENSTDYARRKEYYEEAVKIIMDWVVEVPVYQRNNAVLLNATKFDASTLDCGYSTYWNWEDELYLMSVLPKMNQAN